MRLSTCYQYKERHWGRSNQTQPITFIGFTNKQVTLSHSASLALIQLLSHVNQCKTLHAGTKISAPPRHKSTHKLYPKLSAALPGWPPFLHHNTSLTRIWFQGSRHGRNTPMAPLWTTTLGIRKSGPMTLNRSAPTTTAHVITLHPRNFS